MSKREYKQEIERLKGELREQQDRGTRKIREEEEMRRRLEEENRRLKVRAESVEEELKQAVGQLSLILPSFLFFYLPSANRVWSKIILASQHASQVT